MEAHDDGDHTMIIEDLKYLIKGKRSKRRRPSSALSLTLASTTTTTSSSSSSTSTTTTTTTEIGASTTIELTNILQDNHTNNNNDQLDIANCLMLLSHGHHQPPPRPPSNTTVPTQPYVYECKTCDRGFTSFQALGGHRASHNKPHKHVLHHELSKDHRTSSILNIGPNNIKPFSCNPSGSITKWPKVHECSICGSGFTSGQALGGHMRRHRSMITTTSTTTRKPESTHDTSNQRHESKKHKTLLPLELDLNLPAPMEDHDHKETTNISFGSNNNQIIVFSTPSFVGCHF